MAVQSIDYERYSTRGDDSEEKYKLSVVAKVTMDAGDGVITALSASGLPPKGSTYDHFGETHPATLRNISVNRIRKNTPSKSIIDLLLTYEQEKPEQQDPSGGPTEDPASVQAVLTPGYRFASRAIELAEFVEYVDSEGNTIAPAGTSIVLPGYVGVMVNAADVPISPFDEQEVAFPTLTLEKYFRTWNNLFDEAVLTTNNAEFLISFPDGTSTIVYERTFAPRELLLQNITATQKQFGNAIWYWLRFEFWIGQWTVDKANLGYSQRESGFSSGPALKPILNEQGERIEEPQKLDVSGFLAAEGADPVYMRWRTREESDFNDLGLTF